MPPEFHIRVPLGVAAQAREFIIGQIPGAQIVKELALPDEIGIPESSLTWQEELDHLERWITESQEGIAHDNPLIRAAYVGMFRHYMDIANLRPEYPELGAAEVFTQDILELLRESLEAHKMLPERPAVPYNRYRSHGIVYKRLDGRYGTLSPRNVRIPTFTLEPHHLPRIVPGSFSHRVSNIPNISWELH